MPAGMFSQQRFSDTYIADPAFEAQPTIGTIHFVVEGINQTLFLGV